MHLSEIRNHWTVQFSCSVVSYPLWSHGPQHTRPPCQSPTPRVHLNPCPSSWWCHPTISSSVIHFSSCRPSFVSSGSFQMSQLFASGGESIGVSASTLVPVWYQLPPTHRLSSASMAFPNPFCWDSLLGFLLKQRLESRRKTLLH